MPAGVSTGAELVRDNKESEIIPQSHIANVWGAPRAVDLMPAFITNVVSR